MNLDEEAARRALSSLSQHGLARSAATDGRVAKFEHRINEVFNFHRHELALICVLLLRGPQTPGELRSRTERLYPFVDLDAVQSALSLLMKREPPLVKILPRQPGTKESRYAHLLSGDVQESTTPAVHIDSALVLSEAASRRSDSTRLTQLEDEVTALRSELAELKQQLAFFQKQFQ
jgi:hypothetical protein